MVSSLTDSLNTLAKLFHQKDQLNTEAERKHIEEVPEIIPDTEQEENGTELQIAASSSSQEENRGANT